MSFLPQPRSTNIIPGMHCPRPRVAFADLEGQGDKGPELIDWQSRWSFPTLRQVLPNKFMFEQMQHTFSTSGWLKMFLFYICANIAVYHWIILYPYRFILCQCNGSMMQFHAIPNSCTRLGTGLENCYSTTHRLQGMEWWRYKRPCSFRTLSAICFNHVQFLGLRRSTLIEIDLNLRQWMKDEQIQHPQWPSTDLEWICINCHIFSSLDLCLQVVLLMEVCPGGPSSESILESYTEDGLY